VLSPASHRTLRETLAEAFSPGNIDEVNAAVSKAAA
jgi:hypothetical protein